jgi:hypothetical protein
LYEAALTMAHRLHAPRDHHTVAQAHLKVAEPNEWSICEPFVFKQLFRYILGVGRPISRYIRV